LQSPVAGNVLTKRGASSSAVDTKLSSLTALRGRPLEPMTFKVTEEGFERDGQRTLNQLANRNAQFDAADLDGTLG
jgi:hypothetical protein